MLIQTTVSFNYDFILRPYKIWISVNYVTLHMTTLKKCATKTV